MTLTIELKPEMEAKIQHSAEQRGMPIQEYIQRLIEDSTDGKEISPLLPSENTLRPFGLCAGQFTVPDDFDAPLPDDILAQFFHDFARRRHSIEQLAGRSATATLLVQYGLAQLDAFTTDIDVFRALHQWPDFPIVLATE